MKSRDFHKAVEFINANFDRKITLDEVAAHVRLSKFHFSRLFKKKMGLTFVEYLTRVRIQKAEKLLKTQSILETCYDVGYDSPAHFNRTFKLLVGVTPRTHQIRVRGKEPSLVILQENLPDCKIPDTSPRLAEQFHIRLLGILRTIKDQELTKIRLIAEQAARTLLGGGKVYGEITIGHMILDETQINRPGNPRLIHQFPYFRRDQVRFNGKRNELIFRPTNWFLGHKGYEKLAKGDLLITNFPAPQTMFLRRNGVAVAGVAAPYIQNETTPRNKVVRSFSDITIEEVATTVIYPHVPWTIGLVQIPGFPHMFFGPGTAIAQILIYWSLSAGIASRLFRPKTTLEDDYLQAVTDRVDRLKSQLPRIEAAAARMAQRVSRGGHLHIAGETAIVKESCVRASGLMGIEPLGERSPGSGDTVIIASYAPARADHLAIADRARRAGAYTIALGPAITSSGTPSELAMHADDILDNLSPEPAGVLRLPGYKEDICPVNGLVTVSLFWMLLTAFIEEMSFRGQVPYVWMGFHLIGAKEYNEAIYPYYLERGF